jgi:DNA-binding NarL/FixJ family response regulator
MSACPDTAEPVAPANPSTQARAARLATFNREQLIVDYLNRGASVAEIAARMGLSDSRGVRGDPGRPSQRGAAGGF